MSSSTLLNPFSILFPLPIEWIPSEDGLYLPNLCTLPFSVFHESSLSTNDWIEVEWISTSANLPHSSKVLCHCTYHSNPEKKFISILGPSIQTHPNAILEGTSSQLKVFKFESLPKLDVVKLTILSLRKPLIHFIELDSSCKAMHVAREIENFFVKNKFIVTSTSFEIEIISTSPTSGGLITNGTQIILEDTLSAPHFASIPSAPPVAPPALESVYPPLFKWISTAITTCVPKAILVHGPSGVGKSYAVREMSKYCNLTVLELQPDEVRLDFLDETETTLNRLFQRAHPLLRQGHSVLLFFKAIDVVVTTSTRWLYLFLSLLDRLLTLSVPMVLVATTCQFHALPTSFLRPGRFDHHLPMHPPTQVQRFALLNDFILNLRHLQGPNTASVIEWLAQRTSGYVAADLHSLVHLYPFNHIELSAFENILKRTQPSLTRQYFLNLDRSLTWESVAGLDSVKEQLKRYVLWPQTYPDQFLKLGLRPPRGILLYGPPGCSKTTLAKILAVQSGYQFFALSAASILDSHVGESERNLRACFALANQVGPSIIFLDEVDVLGQRQSSAETNVMSTLLNLMDGMEELQVLVLGATNYPDRLDSALIRVGRFDRLMYIGPPDLLGRKAIFQYYLSKSPTQANISLDELAEKTELATGAEIENICRQACIFALREDSSVLTMRHLEMAVKEWTPFLNHEMLAYYEKMLVRFSPTSNCVRSQS